MPDARRVEIERPMNSESNATIAPPLVLFEDADLLVINKPAGWNTHAPAPHAGEGVYEWLRHREPRRASLAIVHRLDKETSGVMVFGKSPTANKSLTEQFTAREVHKRYVFITDRPVVDESFNVESALVRAGEKYLSRPIHAGGERAETRFRVLRRENDRTLVEAEPVTGRTHQIRVHAASRGLPILGDVLYGGSPAPRLCLHAESISFRHPVSGREAGFRADASFDHDPRLALRQAIIGGDTDAFRIVHGGSDGWPGWQVDRLGSYLLSQSESPLEESQRAWLERQPDVRGVYHKRLDRQVRRTAPGEASPQLLLGTAAPERFAVSENGVRYELSFNEGYSVGLFLDQRDNRRRFLVNHVAAGFPVMPSGPRGAEVLNTFAYTCGFSVCAARAGARVTSLDLSRKYLDWGRRNFELNDLVPADHDFIFGDTFEWLRRLAKKGRAFDVIVLDPPTFSQSKEHGVFRAEKDYGELVTSALRVLKPGGTLLASTNAASLAPEDFLADIDEAIRRSGRKNLQHHYVPQPPDFPISREQPAYLKTVWLRIG